MADKHMHVRDRDLNHYVIPESKRGEWESYLDDVEQGEAAIQPAWARMVDRLDGDRVAEEMSA